ncbi:zinc finger protein [Macleaya cordata]|uniref:Zinc finger protein n=1 Tax=Macleaya cordata TaxID=56857 RepID=A0A200Q929_MACCD|nr:zinc finger protein [Macleaya cordata]
MDDYYSDDGMEDDYGDSGWDHEDYEPYISDDGYHVDEQEYEAAAAEEIGEEIEDEIEEEIEEQEEENEEQEEEENVEEEYVDEDEPILYEQQQQQSQQQSQRQSQQQPQSQQQSQQQPQPQQQQQETETFPQIAENDGVEVVGVDERTAEEERGRSRREEGESSSSPTENRIEREGISSKRGESNGNVVDGVCCSICMEPWSSEGDHQVSCLPCGHVYGLSCIKTWIQLSSYSKCPQCNRQCGLEDIKKLYVSRLAVADGEQQKKILSLQAENDFLKMKVRLSSCKNQTAAQLVIFECSLSYCVIVSS